MNFNFKTLILFAVIILVFTVFIGCAYYGIVETLSKINNLEMNNLETKCVGETSYLETMATEATEATLCTEQAIEATKATEANIIIENTENVYEATTVDTEPTETTEEVVRLISLGQFKLTAYCSCGICCGKYANNRPIDEDGNEIVYGSIGVRLIAGTSIAVDPSVIPYNTEVVINGHTYIAHDTGGSIKGNRIDIYFNDHQEAKNFGIQYAKVYKVGK